MLRLASSSSGVAARKYGTKSGCWNTNCAPCTHFSTPIILVIIPFPSAACMYDQMAMWRNLGFRNCSCRAYCSKKNALHVAAEGVPG